MQCLREAARTAVRGLQSGQKTFKDLPVNKSKHVERWYDRREDLELHQEITGPMLASGFFWGLVVPYLAYEALVAEFYYTPRNKGQELMLMPEPVPKEPPHHHGGLDEALEE